MVDLQVFQMTQLFFYYQYLHKDIIKKAIKFKSGMHKQPEEVSASRLKSLVKIVG